MSLHSSGAFSAQLVDSTFEEIQKSAAFERQQQLLASTPGGAIGDRSPGVSWLPSWISSAILEFQGAQESLNIVIADEVLITAVMLVVYHRRIYRRLVYLF